MFDVPYFFFFLLFFFFRSSFSIFLTHWFIFSSCLLRTAVPNYHPSEFISQIARYSRQYKICPRRTCIINKLTQCDCCKHIKSIPRSNSLFNFLYDHLPKFVQNAAVQAEPNCLPNCDSEIENWGSGENLQENEKRSQNCVPLIGGLFIFLLCLVCHQSYYFNRNDQNVL